MTGSTSRSNRCNAILGFTAAEDSGVVHVQGGDIGSGAATKVLMLDTHGSMGPAVLGGVLATTALHAGLLIGGDDEPILFEGAALPLARISIEHTARLGSKLGIARKYPAALIPGPNSVFM
jgi:hypothetical protein